ncbi:MAG: chemotaxis protein CheC [Oscillospiraceae bacterium]|jgi:chemotaxis protein CheC|nr:chemotaxis protein CheC [Oscillospiraceae bacterium]
MLNFPREESDAENEVGGTADLKEKIYAADSEVLREIGNIGMGHAATSLAQMLNRRIDMTPPVVSFFSKKEFADTILLTQSEDFLCYQISLQGNAEGRIIHMFGEHFALSAINMFFGGGLTNLTETDDMTRSVIQEITNITSGSYCNALAAMTGEFIDISTPTFREDAECALGETAELFSDNILTIDSHFLIDGNKKERSRFLFFPDGDTAYMLYKKLKEHFKIG